MKGTVKRGRTTREDRAQAGWLQQSEKNRAENVMIVDMIRNDLGRIARTGSVHVPELFRVERYPTLWQMTSTVTARTTASLAGIFTALFPCASITCAPKVSDADHPRAGHHSTPDLYRNDRVFRPREERALQCGYTNGVGRPSGTEGRVRLGGGIVWDSTSSDEYAEALLKARILTETPPHFSLLETMLWHEKTLPG